MGNALVYVYHVKLVYQCHYIIYIITSDITIQVVAASVAVADVVLKTAIDVPADQVVRAAPAVQIVDLGRAAVQADSLTTGSARAGTYRS